MTSVAAPLLAVDDLSVRFHTDRGALAAVDGVSFDVAEGETLAIVGESGSGKSVTAMSILRLVQRPAGEIAGGRVMFEGRDLMALSERQMQEIRGDGISLISQEPMSSLNPALSIGLQVGEPLNRHRGMAWPEALKEAEALLRRVHIPDAANRVRAYPHEFSGGMRQRAIIAMALACTPRLIIADEPTTALDVTVQAQILELLKQLTREAASAMILITHDLGVVARYADRVCVMYAGRVVESGTALEIYEDPRHPYTMGLMASVPRLDDVDRQRLVPIEGQPPDLAAMPPGCAFAPRCRFVTDRCRRDRPVLEPVDGTSHNRACFADVTQIR